MADTNAGPPSGSSSRIDELRARWEGDRSSRIFLQLAEELRRHQRVDEALAVLEVGVEQHPQWGAAQVALGRCRIELGRYELGCLVLETVVRKDPTQMVAYRLLVDGYLGMGEAEEARQRLELYSELNPQDQDLAELEQRVNALSSGSAAVPTDSATPPPPPAPPVGAPAAGAPAVEAKAPEAPSPVPPPPVPPEPIPALTTPPVVASPSPIGHGSELFTIPSSAPAAPLALDLSNLTPARRLSRPGLSQPEPAAAVLEPPESGVESPDLAADLTELPSLPEIEPDEVPALAREPLPASQYAVQDQESADQESADQEAAAQESPPEGQPLPIGADVQLQAPIVIDPGTGQGPPAVGDAPTLETRNPLSDFDAAVPAPTEVGSEDIGSEDGSFDVAASIEELAEPIELPDQVDLGAAEIDLETSAAQSQQAETEPLIRDPAHFEPPPPLSSSGELPALPTSAPPAATSTLGELYLDQGHSDEARDIFEQVLDRDPENQKAREGLDATTHDGASDTHADDQTEQPPPALDAMTLLRGHQAAEEGGVTERKSAVLEAYLQRVRPADSEGEGSDVP